MNVPLASDIVVLYFGCILVLERRFKELIRLFTVVSRYVMSVVSFFCVVLNVFFLVKSCHILA